MNKSYIKMKFSLALAAIFMMILGSAYAQQTVTIGSEDLNPRAILKLEGDGSQGFLLPIADKDDFIPQASDAGMLIYDSSDNLVYFWNGSAWVSVNTSTGGGGSSFGLVLDAATGELSIVENGGNSNVSISLAQVDGDITGTIGNTTIADGAVTLNKIANNGNIRSLLANSSGGVVGWLSPNSDNQVLGTDGTGDLTFRDVVDASTGIADVASASDSRLVTEAAIRDALEAAGVSQSLQGAYDGGDGTIQMNSAKNINITNSASNSILSIDHDAQSVGIGVESSFAKLSVNGRVAIFGNGDIGTALDNIPPIDLAIDDSGYWL